MCGPALAPISLALSAVGGVYSAMQQNAIGKQNQAIADAQAAQTREIGRENERKSRSRMERLIAQQRGQFAARGVRLDSVSAERLGQEAGEQQNVEAQAQRFNTDSRATALTNEGLLHRARGKAGAFTGLLKTGASTLTGALDLWPELAGT